LLLTEASASARRRMAEHCVDTGGGGRWNDYTRGFRTTDESDP
jgi:hypothetical protein